METTTQEAPPEFKMPEPERQHKWLQKFIGEWRTEAPCYGENSDTPVEGRETISKVGETWIEMHGFAEANGDEMHTRMMLGYDPKKEKFVGTWIGNMMTHLWVYEGTLDHDEKVLTLNCEGPSFSGDGTMQAYQDIHEFVDDDHRILRARTKDAEGNWSDFFMTTHYHRVK